VSNSIL